MVMHLPCLSGWLRQAAFAGRAEPEKGRRLSAIPDLAMRRQQGNGQAIRGTASPSETVEAIPPAEDPGIARRRAWWLSPAAKICKWRDLARFLIEFLH
jgi:hypothetical protein